MTKLEVKFRRSPLTLVVDHDTIVIDRAYHNAAAAAAGEFRPVESADESEHHNAGELDSDGGSDAMKTEATSDLDVSFRPAVVSLPTSIATIIADASGKIVTPLAQSNAVPILSGATHELLTAAEMGFGGVSEEELSEVKQMLATAAELVTELQKQHRQSLSEMQEVAVELAAAAASWLVGVAIDRDQFAVDDLIRNALQHMELDQPVRVRLNPADHALLKNLIRDPEGRALLANVSCFDDAALVRGSCRVESGRRILLTDMNSRLEDVRRSWMEKMDDSQVERRGDGSASRTLRRFPDRRETA